MPRISDERRRARRSQILDAARACFLRQGLHMTTMDDIIRASGLSAGAVYGYFATKEELILAAIDESMTALAERLRPLLLRPDPPPPLTLLAEIGREVDAMVADGSTDLRRIALLGWAEAQRSERMRDALAGHYGRLREALTAVAAAWRERGMTDSSAPPPAVARAVLALAMGYAAQATVLGGIDPETLAEGVRGLAPRPRGG